MDNEDGNYCILVYVGFILLNLKIFFSIKWLFFKDSFIVMLFWWINNLDCGSWLCFFNDVLYFYDLCRFDDF